MSTQRFLTGLIRGATTRRPHRRNKAFWGGGFLGILLAVTPAAAQSWGAFLYGETNAFRVSVIPGFNDPAFIESGSGCLDLSAPAASLPTMIIGNVYSDPLYAYFLFSSPPRGASEFGIEITMDERGFADDRDEFEVWVSAGFLRAGATLRARIRRFNAVGSGANVAVDLPVEPILPNPDPTFTVTQPEMCWVKADIALDHQLDLDATYWFTVYVQGGQLTTGYYNILTENEHGQPDARSALVVFTDGSWYQDGWPDPMILVRRRDGLIPNHRPTACFTADKNSVKEGGEICFNAGCTEDPDVDAGIDNLQYQWDFGDGESTVYSGSPTTCHTYAVDGDNVDNSYTVTLTVKDSHDETDTHTMAVTITESHPPQVGPITFTRTTGPMPTDACRVAIQGVHTGDTQTEVCFHVDATDPDGDDTKLSFEWRSDRLTNPFWELPQRPQGTMADLGLTAEGEHLITLTVTDEDGKSTSVTTTWMVAPLPTLTFSMEFPYWIREEFRYKVKFYPVLDTGVVGLKAGTIVEPVDGNGNFLPASDVTERFLGPIPPNFVGYPDQPCAYKGTFAWDTSDPRFECRTLWKDLTTRRMESYRMAAHNIQDENGYFFPDAIVSNRSASTMVVVSDYKRVHYLNANSFFLIGDEAISNVWDAFEAPWVAAGLALGGAILEGAAYLECNKAHQDPVIPDPVFDQVVPFSPATVQISSPCVSDPSVQDLLVATEKLVLSVTALDAAQGSMDKLAGAYEAYGLAQTPGEQNAAFEGQVLQGTEIIRFGQVVADEMGAMAAAAEARLASSTMTPEDFAAYQQRLAANGFSQAQIDQMANLGLDPTETDNIKQGILNLDPNEVVQQITDFDASGFIEFGRRILDDTYFAAPTRIVLVAVTQPLMDQPVAGTITIDARVVHKKEETMACACGPTLVTTIHVDGREPPQSSVPYPPGPWCPAPPPPPPYPEAVPATLDTTSLLDGAHTITATAQDSMGCPPGGDSRAHLNTDTIAFFVDNTPPTLVITSPDADAGVPGIQVLAGDDITYTADDPETNGYSSGLIDPYGGTIPTGPGSFYEATVCVADRAQNTASETVVVVPCVNCDCNGNTIPDYQEILVGESLDCNDNGIPDACEIDENSTAPGGPFFCTADCDPDCNNNGVPDACEPDCDNDGTLDECELAACTGDPGCEDCNGNGIPDACDISSGTTPDCQPNGIPDVCEIREDLYGSVPNTRELVLVDAATGATTLIGAMTGALGNVTEIEWSPDGSTLYATTGGGTRGIHTIDPATGAVLTTVMHPAGALNGLEFDASGNLLGTFVLEPGAPSELVVVDPSTGILTPIGPTGFGNIGGLAFDSGFTTLYGVTSGQTVPPLLLSVDPVSGAATPIAATDLLVELSSLEFDSGGRLLAGADDANIYELDPVTGVSTRIGPTNDQKLSGLSVRPGSGGAGDRNGNGIPDECEFLAIPAGTEWGMILLALLVLAAGTVLLRRRLAPAA